MTVANATTSAQFFHLLRRQVHVGNVRPLVVFTPKSGLRARWSRSSVDELVSGTFREVLDDPAELDTGSVRRVVIASGKAAFDAIGARDESGLTDIAVVRIEQLYPWPEGPLSEVLARYPDDAEVVWLQEEPANMGAWSFVRSRIDELLGERRVTLIGRPESGSPACGSVGVHQQERDQLIEDVLA